MNLERGLARLQRYLRADDIDTARQVTRLGSQLRTLRRTYATDPHNASLKHEYETLVNSLDKVANRSAGMPFAELCAKPRCSIRSSMSALPVLGVLLLLIAGLLVLGLGIASASSWVQGPLPPEVARLRKRVEKIDARIGIGVTSPFYMSDVSPCYGKALEKVSTQADLSLSHTKDCVWVYEDAETGQVIAKDKWQWEQGLQPVLQQRVYYSDTTVFAQDSFGSQESDCFRRREYYIDGEAVDSYRECYSEAGRLRSIESATVLSPIPPMAYWFFYR